MRVDMTRLGNVILNVDWLFLGRAKGRREGDCRMGRDIGHQRARRALYERQPYQLIDVLKELFQLYGPGGEWSRGRDVAC